MICDRVTDMLAIASRYQSDSHQVSVMAVTKYATLAQTQAVIDCGITLIGENKVQAGMDKLAHLERPSVECHLIGHLQTNKVHKAVSHFSMIQSVDSLKLLQKIGSSDERVLTPYPVLLEVNIGREPQKHGFLPEDLLGNPEQFCDIDGVDIRGIMVIPPFSPNPEDSRGHFKETKKLYERLKSVYSGMHILSMGMSTDFEVALQEGSHLIRVGSYFFN